MRAAGGTLPAATSSRAFAPSASISLRAAHPSAPRLGDRLRQRDQLRGVGLREVRRGLRAWPPQPASRLLAESKASGQAFRQPALADFGLGSLDRILDTPERCPPRVIVNQEPRGARVAVARLADRAGVQEPAALGQVDLASLRRDRRRSARPRERERDVAVADEHERRRGRLKLDRRLLAEHVVPDRVERAPVEELDAFAVAAGASPVRNARASSLEHALRPAHRRGRVAVELVERERADHGEVVVAGETERGALAHDRAAPVRPRSVADDVAEAPDLVGPSASTAARTASRA